MFWAGITRSSRRISKFLEVNAKMNSENFIKILKQAPEEAQLEASPGHTSSNPSPAT
jgi:hypothetical protein